MCRSTLICTFHYGMFALAFSLYDNVPSFLQDKIAFPSRVIDVPPSFSKSHSHPLVL